MGISFQFHNLAGQYLSAARSAIRRSFDLIICRNVMIYFGPELMRRIVRQISRLSGAGGLAIGGSFRAEHDSLHVVPRRECSRSHVVSAAGHGPESAGRHRARGVPRRCCGSLGAHVRPLSCLSRPAAFAGRLGQAHSHTRRSTPARQPGRLERRSPLRKGTNRVRQTQCTGSFSLCVGYGADGERCRIGEVSSQGHLSGPASGSAALSSGPPAPVAR